MCDSEHACTIEFTTNSSVQQHDIVFQIFYQNFYNDHGFNYEAHKGRQNKFVDGVALDSLKLNKA